MLGRYRTVLGGSLITAGDTFRRVAVMLYYQQGIEHGGSVGKGEKECMVNNSPSRGHDRLPERKGKKGEKAKVDRLPAVSALAIYHRKKKFISCGCTSVRLPSPMVPVEHGGIYSKTDFDSGIDPRNCYVSLLKSRQGHAISVGDQFMPTWLEMQKT